MFQKKKMKDNNREEKEKMFLKSIEYFDCYVR